MHSESELPLPERQLRDPVCFDGSPLRIEDVVAIARESRDVQLSTDPAFRERIARGADFLDVAQRTEADLRINDPGISRRHARIEVHGDGDELQITIEDLGSTNGILINGQRVRQATLSAGSRFEIGSTRLAITSPTSVFLVKLGDIRL